MPHKQRDGSRLHVQCSDSVVLYNKYMGVVDKGDQLRQYYQVRSKCKKNCKYVYDFVFDTFITNAFILSHHYIPTSLPSSKQTMKEYRLWLAEQLIGNYNSRKRSGRPRSTTTVPHPPPALLPPADCSPLPARSSRTALHLPSKQKKARCVYCKKYRRPPQNHEVVWCCKECPGTPALCLTGRDDSSDCYRVWHAKLL